jgi:hypothetical protein
MDNILFKKEAVTYGVVPNDLLNDKRISLKAKGLYAFIYSQEVPIALSIKSIASDCLEGIDSIRSGLKELKNYGYLEIEKFQTSKGFVSVYYLSDTPKIQVVIN